MTKGIHFSSDVRAFNFASFFRNNLGKLQKIGIYWTKNRFFEHSPSLLLTCLIHNSGTSCLFLESEVKRSDRLTGREQNSTISSLLSFCNSKFHFEE